MRMLRLLAVAAALLPSVASAQTSPNLRQGQVLTPTQWNNLFASKQDTLGYVPMNVAGGTFAGRVVTTPPSTLTAGFNLTPGSTPGSPINGDLWATSAGLFVRINGATVNVSGGGAPLVVNSTPIMGGTSGGILFNNGGTVSNTDTTSGANLFMSGTLDVSVPAGLLTAGVPRRALNTFTSVTGGPYNGAVYSSLHTAVANSIIRGNGDPGTGTGANWIGAQFSGSIGAAYDTQDSLGTPVVGQAFTLSAGMVPGANNNTKSDLVPVSCGFYNNFNLPNARGYGCVSAATVGASGTTPTLIGTEVSSSIISGGTVQDRLGVNVTSYWTGTASRLNYAISVQRGNPGGEYSAAIGLNPYQDGTTQPVVLKTTGNFIEIPTAQTLNSIIYAPTAITSYVFLTQHSVLTGNGILTLGDAAAPGGIAVKGGSGDNLQFLFQHGAVQSFIQGAVAGNAYFTAVGAGANAWQVDHTTNLLSAPSGLTVTGNFTLAGSTSGGLVVKSAAIAGSNTLTLPAGTTNFSATGGTSQVVAQGSAGAALTVRRLACADLSDAASGCSAASGITALTGDVTATGPGSVGATVVNLTTGVTVAGTMLHTNIAAPSTPASGKVIAWADSTDLRFHDKNASGVIGTTVVADTGAANNYISAISAAGAITKSRPACATLSDFGAFCSGTDAANLTGTVASARLSGSYTGITGLGTLTAGVTGAGFTIALTISTVSGTLPCANHPALTNDVTTVAGNCAATLATAQPAVHTWALAQTFTVAPVFTDQSGSRTALGLGTAATQNTGTSGANVPLLNGANTWSATQTFTLAPVFTDQSGSRTALGLGTAATQNTGTSGANVPLLNGANTWSAGQTMSAALTYGGVTLSNAATGTGKMVLDTAPQLSTIELGNASDTTISRVSAGVIAVEGATLPNESAGTNSTGLTLTFTTPGNLVVTSYSSRSYSYLKHGRKVSLSFNMLANITQTTASGDLTISGLPFTAANDSTAQWHGTMQWGGITKVGYTDIAAVVGPNSTLMIFVASKSGSDIATVAATDVPSGLVRLQGSVEYWTD